MKWLWLLLMVIPVASLAQVANNNIQQRLELLPEQGLRSTTAGSTVEWSCINRSLTNKCLVYHNDQWFSFVPPKDGTWFINISAQQCRDGNGVQMIVIEGNPCEVKTYRLLNCISQIRREDVYVKLDSVKAGTTYLVNIDGFLGDYCTFDITLSERPAGLSHITGNLQLITPEVSRDSHVVTIGWVLEDLYKNSFNGFRVFRKHGSAPATLVAEVSSLLNALGNPNTKYAVIDTLDDYGHYKYEVFGVQRDDQTLLLASRFIDFAAPFKELAVAPVSFTTKLPIQLRPGMPFRVVVYDRLNGSKLRSWSGLFKPDLHKQFEIDFREWVDEGVRQFQVLVVEDESPEPEEHYFLFDSRRGIVKE